MGYVLKCLPRARLQQSAPPITKYTSDRASGALASRGLEHTRILDEQALYYRERAVEHDETSTPPGDTLAAHGLKLREALRAFRASGKVLELACGTGNWTRELVPFADEITALDASSEMLRLNAEKFADDIVRYIEADVFSWEPEARYDVVLFAFWLSHVPPGRFEEFWRLVERCLAPGGRVFFADEGRHDFWQEDFVAPAVVRRYLRDGSEHRAVKVFWETSDLQRRLSELEWDITVDSVGPFYYGHGGRR